MTTTKTEYNLATMILQAAEEKPDGVFLEYRGNPITFREGLDRSRRCAGFLRSGGVEQGDRVLIILGNIPEFIYSYLAIVQLGAIGVLVNPAARRYEFRHYIEETEPKYIITDSKQIEHFKTDEGFFFDPDRVICVDADAAHNRFGDILERSQPYEGIAPVEEYATASIIFTSAMEGKPLGAQITHAGIFGTARAYAVNPVLHTDKFLLTLPLFHSYGLASSLFTPLYKKIPTLLVNRYSPKRIHEILLNDGVTIFCGVPIMFQLIPFAAPEGTRYPSLRVWVSGGEAISVELQKLLMDRFEIDIRQGYGLTEASPIVTWNLIGTPNKFGSIGIPMVWNEIKIERPDGSIAQPNEEGELIVKGVNVISGYYKNPEKTREVIRDGWLHTGDLGYVDADGYFYITGRKKDMIIKNGLNIYPKEVERLISMHPSVENVRITGHVVKNEDSTTKETITAEIYRKKGHTVDKESLIEWCKGNISSYKLPDDFDIRN